MTELVMCLTRQCMYTKQTTMEGSAFGFQTIPVWEPHSAHGAEWRTSAHRQAQTHVHACAGTEGRAWAAALNTPPPSLTMPTPQVNLQLFLGFLSFILASWAKITQHFMLFCDFDKNLI